MSGEVASHLSGIIRSMAGFLAAIMDPEIGRHAADPAASNFIAGQPPGAGVARVRTCPAALGRAKGQGLVRLQDASPPGADRGG